MAEQEIHVEEEYLNKLKSAIQDAGQEYKRNFAALTNLIDEITSGDIQGDLADELVTKFRDKEDTLKGIVKTIEEAEDYMGLQTTKFGTMITDVKANMN